MPKQTAPLHAPRSNGEPAASATQSRSASKPAIRGGRTPGHGFTSKVTYRWQTTLPSGVRRALGLQAGDQITYVVEGDRVLIRKAEEADDPVILAYLDFLAQAMRDRPELIRPFAEADVEGLEELLEGVASNLDEDLGDFELP
jgi:antitoxin PrlF